jgi:hypothetical protein
MKNIICSISEAHSTFRRLTDVELEGKLGAFIKHRLQHKLIAYVELEHLDYSEYENSNNGVYGTLNL